MSIVSHYTIADAHEQTGGYRYVKHAFIDDAGTIHMQPLHLTPAAWTETEYLAQRAAMVAEIEVQLAAAELEALINGA